MDFISYKVKNGLIVVGIIAGLMMNWLFLDTSGLGYFVWGIFTPIVLLFIVYILAGLGAGDIKLFSVVGAFLGPAECISVIAAAFLISAVICLVKISRQKSLRYHLQNLAILFHELIQMNQVKRCTSIVIRDRKRTIHFSLPILLAALLLWGKSIFNG